MSMTTADTCKLKISELQQKLLAATPDMPVLLREIHQILSLDPEVVTLLKPEEIGVIVSSLKKHKDVVIVENVMKKKSSKGGKAITAESLGLDI